MGESTCLMMQMQPFSYVSGLPCFDPTEGNRDAIRSLGQSISFGRFVSDSVSWEKWSVFSHNRYVEEAERYARPGSVAQKKAFFEAHYREMAARKAAAAAAAAAEAELEAEQVSAASDEARNSLLDEVATGDSAPALDCNDPNGQDEVGETEQCGTPEIEKPLLKKLTSNGTSRKPVATPRSSRTPIVRSVVESKSAGPKGKSLANDSSSSKLLSACKSKLQSPGVSTPFKLKTIERSARRKEKLEEKFNADEAQKVQQQAKMVKETRIVRLFCQRYLNRSKQLSFMG
ncbi:hypothetical protein CRG98_011250 [Punica granatum]|uniref:TPX2 C-terminal domain-containing protein n=1 Tax=Punica granatum TaxID=22663 RepID=A0A2I0KIJ4_PUNGR|nr:hypothetical protein CRG98_011250 [Punica granatum]